MKLVVGDDNFDLLVSIGKSQLHQNLPLIFKPHLQIFICHSLNPTVLDIVVLGGFHICRSITNNMAVELVRILVSTPMTALTLTDRICLMFW